MSDEFETKKPSYHAFLDKGDNQKNMYVGPVMEHKDKSGHSFNFAPFGRIILREPKDKLETLRGGTQAEQVAEKERE